MAAAKMTDDEFIAAWHAGRFSPAEVARLTGIDIRNVYHRREALINKGVDLPSVKGGVSDDAARSYWTYPKQINADIDTGVVVVGSDAHLWPGTRTTAAKALMLVTAELSQHVKMLVANGDWLDGARTNRHDPHGWNHRPSVKEEVQCVTDTLHDWSVAAKIARSKALRIYTIGNHELNYERYLVTKAKDFEGMPGMRLADNFPDWEFCWSTFVNRKTARPVMIKHRHAGGVHAGYNNTMKGGVTMVTGHTHILESKPWGDYRGRRWGVQTGTLAQHDGPQFEYAENGPSPACSGFAVLTFKDGLLLPPELCEVIEGRAYFRGQVVVDDHAEWAEAA